MTGSELWKPVLGFEGRYSVSNFGRIQTRVWTIMAPNTANAGGTFENDDLLTWVELDIRSGRGEAIPACTSASVLYAF